MGGGGGGAPLGLAVRRMAAEQTDRGTVKSDSTPLSIQFRKSLMLIGTALLCVFPHTPQHMFGFRPVLEDARHEHKPKTVLHGGGGSGGWGSSFSPLNLISLLHIVIKSDHSDIANSKEEGKKERNK